MDKLEDNVKKGITFHLVGDMEEVLALAFPKDRFAKGTGAAAGGSGAGSADAALLTPEEKLAAAVARAVAQVMKG